jgi:hypothetical protein
MKIEDVTSRWVDPVTSDARDNRLRMTKLSPGWGQLPN